MATEDERLAKIRKQFEDIGPRCDACDLPWGRGVGECRRKDDLDAYNATVVGTCGWGSQLTDAAYKQWRQAEDECRGRRVDWRKRALVAEQRLPVGTREREAIRWLKREALHVTDKRDCGAHERVAIQEIIVPLLDRLLGE